MIERNSCRDKRAYKATQTYNVKDRSQHMFVGMAFLFLNFVNLIFLQRPFMFRSFLGRAALARRSFGPINVQAHAQVQKGSLRSASILSRLLTVWT